MRKYKKIEIFTKSGKLILFNEDDWDDYHYDGKFFTIVKTTLEFAITISTESLR